MWFLAKQREINMKLVECENKKLTEVSYHQKCSKNITGTSYYDNSEDL